MVTHNLEHLWQVCSRVVVMRRGRKVADFRSDETTMEEVVAYITGAKEPSPASALAQSDVAQ
jgi:simple sugar transport system ATP-binding protein/D-xylose transport system ATP-binding protein